MSKFLDELEKATVERIGSGEPLDKQFWYIFSYCKGLEYALENHGKLNKTMIKEIIKEANERI